MSVVYSRIPGKVHYETPRLIVRVFDGREYYWCYQRHRWVKMTKRCPLL
jgi:hypothetical protein